MKNYAPIFIAITCFFSLGCFAQEGYRAPIKAKIRNAQLLSEAMSDEEHVIVSYYVEERINMNFGSSITTYEVSNPSLINTNDLGENNTRIVTPKYGKTKTTAVMTSQQLKTSELINSTQLPTSAAVAIIAPEPVKAELVPETHLKFVEIDILMTYERVIDRGYKTIDMLKRVGNGRFFGGDLITAAKWYNQLFSMTTDLEAEYYYRYSRALSAVNQTEKAKEMMQIFETKSKSL